VSIEIPTHSKTDKVLALAHLYGEPLFKMPHDLYIPPEALAIFLEAFEGPLDLLLYLIRKQNFNVLDIPMAALTQQYLSYVDEIRTHNLDLAGEYLLMAAVLIEIKSRTLLPPPLKDTTEVQDPRADLVRRLIEYEQFKQAAELLNQIPQLDRDFMRVSVYTEHTITVQYPDVSVIDLTQAWADLMRRAKLIQHHVITRESLSVREYMSHILKQLNTRTFFEFKDLFDIQQGVSMLVVCFLALLELSRERLVNITQAVAFAPIYVRLTYTPIAV
jgi:segregation and condensation protein A